MNIQGASDAASHLSPNAMASLPRTLWHYYIDYLWFYDNNSWVAHAAYSCRVMAVLLLLPIIILTLLDIASYVIARTLGVIDDVRASTSDKATVHHSRKPPIIHVHAASRDDTTTGSGDDRALPALDSLDTSHPHAYYADPESEEDSENMKLSGFGVFSPAASQPGSPVLSRKGLPDGGTPGEKGLQLGDEDGLVFRGKKQREGSVAL
ncbi:hypothetical protein BD626DRAFT_390971 [Schizophyllum amplum]|uniref:Uncharacterized protein n=1 Tax=Schizophyllum amplum TaxID=97359 RepID=A0A550CWX7_9AGAR|nr:hypothetical protein BD626DRAFT_390971 [Auriculariopsis ampla]